LTIVHIVLQQTFAQCFLLRLVSCRILRTAICPPRRPCVLQRDRDNISYVVYRVPVTGTRSPRIGYRQSLWLADMWHAY